MEYCDDDRHYLRAKTNPVWSQRDDSTMGSEATNWTMATPITRQQLQGLRKLHVLEKLTEIINEETRDAVLEDARAGGTSYLWIVDQGRLERKLDQRGWASTRVKMDELLEAVKALYPDCDVSLTQEEVLLPQREAAPKRATRAVIRIDWS